MVAYMDKLVGRLVAKLDELGIRDNTLVLFLGDNGTGRGVTSRFQGEDYPGGKGTTTRRGHARAADRELAGGDQPAGEVERATSSAASTSCRRSARPPAPPCREHRRRELPAAAPRREGDAPREWLYCWYSPRQQADLTVREFAFDHGYKLYRTGELFDLAADPFEKQALNRASTPAEARAAAARLQAVLDRFTAHARRNSTASSRIP